MKKEKIGILGGAFNPPHKAHLAIADSFFNEAVLDKLLFIPTFISPFKTGEELTYPVAPEDRINMLKFMIQEKPAYSIDEYEVKKGGISYSYETILYLSGKYPGSEILMLIGGDNARYFLLWKNHEIILENVQLCIAARPETVSVEEKIEINKQLSYKGKEPIWLNSPLLNISSSDIRKKIKNGEDVSPFLPDKVYEYIIRNKLYI